MLLILVRLVAFVARCTGSTLALSFWWNSCALIGQLLLHYAGTREGAEFGLVQQNVSSGRLSVSAIYPQCVSLN